jgi:hypothetical protein
VVAPFNEPETCTLFLTLHLKILKLHFYGKDANLMIWAYHGPIFAVVNVGHVIYPIKIFFFVCIEDSEDEITEEEN